MDSTNTSLQKISIQKFPIMYQHLFFTFHNQTYFIFTTKDNNVWRLIILKTVYSKQQLIKNKKLDCQGQPQCLFYTSDYLYMVDSKKVLTWDFGNMLLAQNNHEDSWGWTMLKIIHEPIFPLQQLIIQHYNSYTEAYLIDINFTIIKYQDEKIVSKLQFPQSARPTHIVYNPQTNQDNPVCLIKTVGQQLPYLFTPTQWSQLSQPGYLEMYLLKAKQCYLEDQIIHTQVKVIEWHHNTVILALADGCLLELLVVKNDISDNQPNQPFNGHHEIIPSYRLEIVSKFRTKSSTPTQTILSLSFESNLLAVLDTQKIRMINMPNMRQQLPSIRQKKSSTNQVRIHIVHLTKQKDLIFIGKEKYDTRLYIASIKEKFEGDKTILSSKLH